MSRMMSVVVGIVLVAGIGTLTFFQARGAKSIDVENNATGTGVYTAADVASHADGASCWTIINGNVYDLTSWIPEHPGGSRAILKLCGINGSEEFNEQHGGMQPMEGILAGFKIGELAQ